VTATRTRTRSDRAEVQLRHHFDAAHRLPQLAGGNSKCASLHGHTWNVTLGITGPIQDDMTVVEFGTVKKAFRAFVDEQLDHGTLIGADDPLLPVFTEHRMKHFVFGRDGLAEGIPWPSVEGVTAVLVRFAQLLTLPDDCYVSGMYVTETVSNAVQWRNP
jgi:6-pyruvoyltetrahydropterin/6-carboxytetrahydropterin synthase